ncbi:ABC transporter permease [Streptomyces sp. NPDC046821]|uniref:ABC transporter permease n=1 Tax=Streptomyces sp. NPDC046821 TaxID=3154702 RepID=UPI0033C7C0E3
MSTISVRMGRLSTARRKKVAGASWLRYVVYPLLALIVFTVVFGPMLISSDANTSHIVDALQAPSAQHWLGTDDQGRDVLARVVLGARVSVSASLAIVVGFSTIGVLVATIATVGGKWVDEVVMRIVDGVLAIPPIIFALGAAAALGPSLQSAIIAMSLTGWPYTARLLRGIMRETASTNYVEGARVLGVSKARLMFKHVLPNSLEVMVVKWAGDLGNTILILGALSFVGVGAQPPSAEWGAAIVASKGDLATAWWPAFAPGVAIAIAAITFGLLGDMLQARFNPDLGVSRG